MPGRARRRQPTSEIEQYQHRDKQRLNNPHVGLVRAENEPAESVKRYAHDPHDPPTLVWAGKVERETFTLPTVSLHVHERIDPRTILEAVRRPEAGPIQDSLFDSPAERPPLREAIEFYTHPHGWTNRLIAGDSLLIMSSLLEKEGMAGQIQTVYVDPPYGVRYGSNFQPFVGQRDVKDQDKDLSHEPEMVRAFRDTWELGIHSYLTYLRERLSLAKLLLSPSGSVFVQISDENLHHVREVMDELFGPANYVAQIAFVKTSQQASKLISADSDFLLWYAKDISQVKYRPLYLAKAYGGEGASQYTWVEGPDKTPRPMTPDERANPALIPPGFRILSHDNTTSAGYSANSSKPFVFKGQTFDPGANAHFKTTPEGLARLAALDRLMAVGNNLRYKRYLDDFPVYPLTATWPDTGPSGFAGAKVYVVQTNTKVVARCVLMTSDPGDLVLDPTCGSGTTAYVAEQYGRRWIACDTSRVAVAIARQRLSTAAFDYYELARPDEGVSSGFKYKTVPHVMLSTLAKNEPMREEALYDQPAVNPSRVRVSGPFTVEAVPAPVVRPITIIQPDPVADATLGRSGPSLRHAEWRDQLQRAGIRAKAGQVLRLARLEPQSGTHYLHAVGETDEPKPRRVAVSFGPEHAPLEQRQVEFAWQEAALLNPRPGIVVFAAFQFDPEAAKDIDLADPAKTGLTFLRVQMDADLLVTDLKKRPRDDQSFWLVGQPDLQCKKTKDGEYVVEVVGFDYWDPRTGEIQSGDSTKIAMWMLDPDYDERSLFPRQVFFPLAGQKDGWSKLARDLKAQIDLERLEAYRGTTSLPFKAGPNRKAAVKIIDDRGIESLRVLKLD